MNQEKSSLQDKNFQRLKEDLAGLQKYVDELTVFLPLAFCLVNSLDIILGINKSFQYLSGYNEMEVIGNKIDILFLDKKEIEEFKKSIPLVKERVTQEALLLAKVQKIPVSISALARRDSNNNFLGYFLTISDISETKKFQEKLEEKVKEKTWELEKKTKEITDSRSALLNAYEETKEKTQELEKKTKEITDSRRALLNAYQESRESEQRAKIEKEKTGAIITNFMDGLLVFNERDVLDIINPKAEEFLKESLENLKGKHISELNKNEHLKDFIKILIKNKFFSSMDSNSRISSREILEIKTGQTLEISVVPVINNQKKIGTLVALHDISREKRIETMKSEFVSIAAHQLRTPLSAIKWTMKILMEGDFGKLNKEQLELLEKTYISNERMVHLINDLLNVARIEEGKYLHKPEITHIEEIIKPLFTSYKIEIEKRKINFELNLPEEITPTIEADTEKMTLVIENLLDNALKYTPQGGKVSLSVKYEATLRQIQVAVSDSGVGIPKDQQDRLFTKFFRAGNVVRMDTEGSGLGLFISKNIIMAHGGDIWFDSQEGKGSTFYFSLPISDKRI